MKVLFGLGLETYDLVNYDLGLQPLGLVRVSVCTYGDGASCSHEHGRTKQHRRFFYTVAMHMNINRSIIFTTKHCASTHYKASLSNNNKHAKAILPQTH